MGHCKLFGLHPIIMLNCLNFILDFGIRPVLELMQFAESWGNQFGLFVPPISIIYRVIKKMIVDRVYDVLVIPCWKSAVFWHFICPNGVFRNEIADWFDLPTERHFLC